MQNPQDPDSEELAAAKLRITHLKKLCDETAEDIAVLRQLDQKYAGFDVQVENLSPHQGSESLHANAAAVPEVPAYHPNQYKMPTSLPQYIPFETRLESFFDKAEMQLSAFGTHESHWPKALINMTQDKTTLHWINRFVLQENLSWKEARAAFTKEMSKQGNSKHQMMDDLQKLTQGNQSNQDFFRQLMVTAHICDQNLNDPFFLNGVLQHNIQPRIHTNLLIRFGETLKDQTFDTIMKTAIATDLRNYCATTSSTTDKLSSSTKKPRTNSTASSYKCFGCGSVKHTRDECPAKEKHCNKCGIKLKVTLVQCARKTPLHFRKRPFQQPLHSNHQKHVPSHAMVVVNQGTLSQSVLTRLRTSSITLHRTSSPFPHAVYKCKCKIFLLTARP